MVDPKFLVNISWVPSVVTGQTAVSVGGVTQSFITHSEGYFMASMPELKISASGSSYASSLNALMAIATASTTIDPGYNPYSYIRTW